MGIRVGEGGPGGTSFTLGPTQNKFTGADIAACRTARDTYATANAAWLTQYNGDRSFFIELDPTTGATVFERRNVAGDAWEEVSNLIASAQLSASAPAAAGTAAPGTSTDVARADHVHPAELGREELFNNLTGTALAMANEWTGGDRDWGNAIEVELSRALTADDDNKLLQFHGTMTDDENSDRPVSWSEMWSAHRFRLLVENDAADTATTIEDGIHIAISRTSESGITGWGQASLLATRARTAGGEDIIKFIPWFGRDTHYMEIRCVVALIG